MPVRCPELQRTVDVLRCAPPCASPAPLLCGCAARRCPELARGWTVRIGRGGPPCTWRYRLTSDHKGSRRSIDTAQPIPLMVSIRQSRQALCRGSCVASFAFAPFIPLVTSRLVANPGQKNQTKNSTARGLARRLG